MDAINQLKEASQKRELEKKNQSEMLNAIDIDNILQNQNNIDDIQFINESVVIGSINDLKKINKKLHGKFISGIAIFSAIINEKPMVSISVSKDLIERSLSASFLAKIIGKELNGGGGGKDDFATAGASSEFSLDDIKSKISKLVKSETEKL